MCINTITRSLLVKVFAPDPDDQSSNLCVAASHCSSRLSCKCGVRCVRLTPAPGGIDNPKSLNVIETGISSCRLPHLGPDDFTL